MTDINCDMGEGMSNDALIMPYITSANIACGYHAGDEETMRHTIFLALKHNVHIGAHPSFKDKENFGRTEMHIPVSAIYELMISQMQSLGKIAKEMGATLHHVKPHGALYNMSAKDENIAAVIAKAVMDFDPQLILFGLSGSVSVDAAKAIGLKSLNEVFADRTYKDDGSLTPRKEPNAMIESVDACVAQVRQMIECGMLTTVSGNQIPVVAETICVHGDGKNAVEFVKALSVNIQ